MAQANRARIPLTGRPKDTDGNMPLHASSRLLTHPLLLQQLEDRRLQCIFNRVRSPLKSWVHLRNVEAEPLPTSSPPPLRTFLIPTHEPLWPAQAHLLLKERPFFYNGRLNISPAVQRAPLARPPAAIARPLKEFFVGANRLRTLRGPPALD